MIKREGFVVWLTGWSGSGKSTIGEELKKKLYENGIPFVQILDGDVVRQDLTRDLGFSKGDRDENIRRITFVAELLSKNGVATIVSFISPYISLRDRAREKCNNFVEVYVKCDKEKLIERDAKGLYKKALSGEIKNFTGISDPYEEPLNPEVVVETDKESVEQSVSKILDKLKAMGLI